MSVETAIRFLPSPHVSGCWMRSDSNTILRETDGKSLHFDYVFDNHSNQMVYDETVSKLVNSICDGFNVTVVAYGQSGSGKTHSMIGDNNNLGIMPLAFQHLMRIIEDNSSTQYMLKLCVLDVYNEKVYDLLSSEENSCCKLIDTKVIGATEKIISSYDQFWEMFKRANGRRKISETRLNGRSSRSHTIFQTIVESVRVDEITGKQEITMSRLMIVDLAGSENARMVNAGMQTKESRNINLSLLALSRIISATADSNLQVSTFRESKLTRILQPAIGGNSKLFLLCCIRREDCHETNSTITFGQNAKRIENVVSRNSEVKDAELPKLLEQIASLKRQLEEREKEKEKEEKLELLQNIVLNSNKMPTPSKRSPEKNRRRHSIAFFSNNSTSNDLLANLNHKRSALSTINDFEDIAESGVGETDSGRCSAQGFNDSNEGADSSIEGTKCLMPKELHDEMSKELSAMKEKLNEVSVVSAANDDKIEELTKQLEATSTQLISAKLEMSETQESLRVKNEELIRANQLVEKLQSLLTVKDAEIQNLEQKVEESRSEMGRMSENVTNLENDLISKTEEIEMIRSQLECSRTNRDEVSNVEKKLEQAISHWKAKYNDMKQYGMDLLTTEKKKNKKAEEEMIALKKQYEKETGELKEKYSILKCRFKEMADKHVKRENEWRQMKELVEKSLEEEKEKAKQLQMECEEANEERDVAINRMTEQTLDHRGTRHFYGKCNDQRHLSIETRLETLRAYNSILKERIRDIRYDSFV